MSKTDYKFVFRVHGVKKNGETRDKTFEKINHALRYLWRIKEVAEARLDALDGNRQLSLFMKLGRRRAVNTEFSIVPEGRGSLKSGPNWSRLPSKFNDIE